MLHQVVSMINGKIEYKYAVVFDSYESACAHREKLLAMQRKMNLSKRAQDSLTILYVAQ